ncbi:Os11g0564700 [Oryza sativa Japonica Group]|uniref:Os11g0564700 protein n=1 Tax=Oryza sativa subsp. japonica TaxID=39947 RepID=A0A0P0Y3E9_ORYSJ|nr:Os11g0564700 [Oryza sativa Japonica Group]
MMIINSSAILLLLRAPTPLMLDGEQVGGVEGLAQDTGDDGEAEHAAGVLVRLRVPHHRPHPPPSIPAPRDGYSSWPRPPPPSRPPPPQLRVPRLPLTGKKERGRVRER